MDSRLELHEKLVAILGSRNVHFQPPETSKMTYPCVIYELDNIDTKHADDVPYLATKRYSVTIIDEDPDSEIPDKLLILPLCSFNRAYTADELNHWVFNLYFRR